MGRLDDKVAFITGAARGQGRSHAIRLAQEGAKIIASDLCDQIPSVYYSLATKQDLDETVRLVQAEGGEIVAQPADVRDRGTLRNVYDAGVAAFGQVDIVVCNAGINSWIHQGVEESAWFDTIAVNLTGAWNTIEVCTPGMIERGAGGSIIITSSAAGLSSLGINAHPGNLAYSASKHGLVGLMRRYASEFARHSIRVNTVNPGGVETPMVTNPEFQQFVEEHPEVTANARFANPLPVALLAPADVSNAVVFLASDEARYITGITMPVDGGYLNG
ncbi:mycofactocin-coupled SDR family oxidoreductase [Streptomyces sp. NPDC001617]